MPTMADYAKWRRYVAFFVALMSLPSLLPLAVGGSTQTNHNAALNQPVSVYPSDATCGKNSERLKYSENNYVVCTAGCGRNITIQKKANRFPIDVIQMGGDKCHISETESGSDELKSSMCWLTPSWSTQFTYSVWFKPTETRTKQSLISNREFQLFLHDGHMEGITYTTAGKVSNVTKLTKIDSSVWTHIAIRVQESRSFPAHVAVFANGAFLAPALQIQNVPGEGQTGGKQFTRTFRIGIAQTQIESSGCEILKIDACASVGYSPVVRMPNRFQHQTQGDAYVAARANFLLGDSRLVNCHWDRDLVARFACTYYIPPCSGNGTVLPPCRSLCTAVMENWCEAVDRLPVTCGDYPDSTDPTVCVGPHYKSDFGLYRGEIRYGLYHERLLTDREIEAEYTGRLRRVRPLSECLCYAKYTPALLTNSSLTCVADLSKGNPSNRLDEDRGTHHVVEFVNDGDLSTAWASRTPCPDEVDIQINFRLPIQIWVIEILLQSHFPSRGIVITSNRSGIFRVMQNLSIDCEQLWYKPNDGVLVQPDSVNCQNISRLAGSSRTPPYTIRLDLRDGRPELPPVQRRRRRDLTGPTLREEFLTSHAIRVGFYGKPLVGNNHIVPEISLYTRNTCGCYPEGTIDGYRCMDGVCQCKNLIGVNIADAGPKCRPYLTRMTPSFGPRSGGTKVVILGGFLGRENSSVSAHTWVEDIAFDIKYSNDTRVDILTPPLTKAIGTKDIGNVATALNVTLESGYELRTTEKFVYKEDPVVEMIKPKQSFLRGGIVQTIIGRHMDSVAFPLMTVTLVYRGRFYKQPTSACSLHNTTEMHCPSPIIHLPSGISKRNLSHISERDSDSGTGYDARMRRQVVERQAADLSDNKDGVKIYIGFLFDGVTTYRNISETLPQQGQMYIYDDPEMYEFEDEVMDFRRNDEQIVIQGDRMNHGCSAGDYNVTVGLGQCEVLDLQTNQLVCRPPKTKPALGQFHSHGDPRVKVVVGNINVVVGYLRYEELNSCDWCYPEGTINWHNCVDGVCQCRHVTGVDVAEAGPKCRPYLSRMIPSFGPRAGGTKVVIIGGFLGRDNSSVSVRTCIEDISFAVEYR
ncbi:hypothetical protein LSAT2_015304 [Lamellibrachia satsuma]|nr:hypothetical protein LSAT2_015304 [Lamellibrachia satsuma]